jgi:hypothetical protein
MLDGRNDSSLRSEPGADRGPGRPVGFRQGDEVTALLPERIIDGPSGSGDVDQVAPAAGSREAPPHGGSPRWALLRPLVRPCGYFLASRAAVLFAALASQWLVPRIHPWRLLGTGWDGSWYTKIAQYGYPHHIFNEDDGSRWAFFPGFPAAIRGTHALTGLNYADAGVLIGTVLGLTSAIAVWLAVREVFGSIIADRSVLIYAFFPAAYVLSMAYSEGLFITAAAGCLFALSRRYWITASLFAVVASLTRNVGVLLFVCVAVVALPWIAREHQRRPLVAVLISPLGFVGWLAYSWHMTGTPLAFLKAEQVWGATHFLWFTAPLIAVGRLGTNLHNFSVGADVLAAFACVFAWVGLSLLWRTRREGVSVPAHWWVFAVGSVLAMAIPDAEQSILRFSLVAFPLFAAFAWKIRPTWEGAIAGTMGFMQGALALVIFVEVLHPLTSTLWP